MLCEFFDRKGCKKLFSFEAAPVCAVDYCDACGDCLHCDREDGCHGKDQVQHTWVVYAEDVVEFLKTHELPHGLVSRIQQIVEGVI